MRTLKSICMALTLAMVFAGCSNNDDPETKDSGPTPDGVEATDSVIVGGEATIFDIMQGKVPEGTSVILRDVVVIAVDGYGEYTGDIFVQEIAGGPYSAIKIYRPQRIDGGGEIADLIPGDHVKVEGSVKYFTPTGGFNDDMHPERVHIKELDQGSRVERISEGTTPEPKVLTPDEMTTAGTAEQWEHALVKIENVAVTSTLHPDFGEFKVAEGLSVGTDLFLHTPEHADCVSLTGISSYFYGYKLHPRNAEDIVDGTGCPTPSAVTIKEIQDESAANHPAVESWVKVTGVISAVDGTPSTGSNPKFYGFWIQDEAGGPYSGIYIYYSWKDKYSDEVKPKLNEKVELYGIYVEHKAFDTQEFTQSEIKYASWVNLGPSSNPPQPEEVSAEDVSTSGSLAPSYDGVLVKVSDVKVADHDKDSKDKVVGLILEQGNLVIGADLLGFLDPTPPAVGTEYSSIAGPLFYSFDEYKILPRTQADMLSK